jgi:ribosomal protein L37E
MLAPVDLDTRPGTCAFCGTDDEDAGVATQERLGVRVAVCAACRERFAGASTPPGPAAAAPRPPAVEAPGLPPTLGQQSSAVLAHVQRMARRAADLPYVEEECAHCGYPVHRYRGADGEAVGLARESVLAASVPAEERWRVVGDRAVRAGDAGAEDGEDAEDQVGARVLHAVVCPANPAPANPRLARMWSAHRTPPPAD